MTIERLLDRLFPPLGVRVAQDRAAARDYFATEKPLRKIWCEFAREHDPRERARLLAEAAEFEDKLAVLHFTAWGPDPIPEEDNRDLSESIASGARLLRLMASVEDGAAAGGGRHPTDDPHLERAAGAVCDELAKRIAAKIAVGAAGAADRDDERDRLYDAVVDVVGGQAAEALACLPSPGRS